MRICLLSREYPPDTGFGGIATFARHLAHGLKEIGHDVVVVSLTKDKDKAKVVDDDGVTVHRVESYFPETELGMLALCIPYSRYVINSSATLWQKFLQLHKELPFDVVDTPELLAEGFFPALTKVAPLTIRLYTPHSKFIAENLHNVSATFDHQFVAMVERVAMLNADAITSPSLDLATFVAGDLNCPLEKIKIVMNPIDANQFSPDGERKLNSENKDNQAKQVKILFVGRLEERKGIRYLIQSVPAVLKAVPNAHFYIIGNDTNSGKGQKSHLDELKEFIAAANCGSNITFIDRIPLTDLPAYYRCADICVVPSVYDNSPYSCLEAMSCGRAVIGTTSGGTREYIVDGTSGKLVPAKEVEPLSAAIIELALNENERKRLGENARRRVLEVFQRSQIARQTVAVYDEAIANFEIRKQNPQYLRSADQVLADMESITSAFDKMVHNLLYQQSYRYRLKYWLHMFKMRPRLFAAKFILRVAGRFSQGAHLKWLEDEIKLKETHQTPTQRQLTATAVGATEN
jgi:glycosyltransferase involved in cell wall biosynthesis